MNDVERVTRAMREIEVILSGYIEPGHKQDAEGTVERIIEAMDKPGVQKAVARLRGEGSRLKMVWQASLHSRDK
jgi:hypothetical protein